MDPSLYEAAEMGDVGFLKRIRGGDVSIDLLHQKTPQGNNILHVAAEFKHTAFLKEVQSLDINQLKLFWATNQKGDTPLHVAARVGSDEVVGFLIEHAKTKRTWCHGKGGYNTDDEESGRATDDGKVKKKLLRMTNLKKDTALHVAARYGHGGVVTLLMAADPKLCHFTNSHGESSLFIATRQGFRLIALSILDKSSKSPSYKGFNGVTALHVAVTRLDEDEGFLETMVSKNPESVKEVDALGWTPLHHAALSGNLEAIRVLMAHDSSASYMKDKNGMSALHVAAYAGHTKVMEELIQRRPDICDLLNEKGQTALHAAVSGGHINVILYILNTPKLARLINEADRYENTPLHLAAIYQNRDIMRMLMQDPRVDKIATNKELSRASDIEEQVHKEIMKNLMQDPRVLDKNIAANRELSKAIDIEEQVHKEIMGMLMQDPRVDKIATKKELSKATDIGEQEIGSSTGLEQLGCSVGLPFFQQQIKRDFWNLKSPPEKDTDVKQGRRESRLLIATLIATVTFAAAFTVPGGTNDKTGLPILYYSDHYKVFLCSNQLAFAAVAFVIYNEIVEKPFLSPRTVELLIRISLGGMVLAFTGGINAVRKAKEEMDPEQKKEFDSRTKKRSGRLFNEFEKTFLVYVILIFLTLALPRAYRMSKVALGRLKFRKR